MRSFAFFVCAALAASASAANSAAEDSLDEVIVTATFRPQSLLDVASSITVLDDRTLHDAGQQHFQDVLNQVPNLFWAGGTSRPRFFQIRGIGEREQYEGAPNSSVGFLIDGIDFSGIGMPATLFDVDRIEVLRGPQGMRYGANALAGLISVHSRDPAEQLSFSSEAFAGDYNTYSYGGSASGPIDSLNSAWRLSVQRYKSDGFRDDTYLNRKDTDGRDELTAHAKWRWRPSADTTVDFTWLHADLDNGYDGWSIDNTRTSLADRPGKDAQQSNGAAVRVTTDFAATRLTMIGTGANSDSEYSFDGDWGNAQSWQPYTYDYFYRALTDRRTRSLEARLSSLDAHDDALSWLVGVYALDLNEDLNETSVGTYIDPDAPEYSGTLDDYLHSQYEARNVALFGEIEGAFTSRWGWAFGLRGEQRTADYSDSGIQDSEPRLTDANERDRMWGGQATLYFQPQQNTRWFATLSRGYKAGGFNLGQAATIRARFAPEYLWSLDLGVKGEWLDHRLYGDATVFYMRRRDMQVATGVQLDPVGNPNSYFFFTDNAAGGRNLGLESSLRWRMTQHLEFGASLGLLQTRYSGYRPEGVDISDRDQAHAPKYQFSINTTWRSNGWMARADFIAVDGYYFDVPPNDARAPAHSSLNLKLGYESDHWSVYAWGRNVFDQDSVIRGFYFGEEPPDFPNKRYVQLGEPRTVGVTARFDW
jgi:outer membrane receptor protein involved in Fe transport